MKKFCFVLASVLFFCAGAVFFTGCTPRGEVLRLHIWEYYIDESIISEFEELYKSETGKNVKVKITTFSSNEEMYYDLSSGQKDFDLVCPSDYTIEKMIENDLVKPLDWSLIENGEKIDPMYSLPKYNTYDPDLLYSVPYLSGTLGILYDPTAGVTKEDASSWEVLFSNKFSGKISMKKSVRDTVAAASLYLAKTELTQAISLNGYDDAYATKLSNILNSFTPENFTDTKLNTVKNTLVEQRSKVSRYEDDEGVNDRINKNGTISVGLYWSCDAGYIMSENQDWEYYVPDEGSNVWVDSFVIPAYAVNVDAAHAFLNFICDPEIAVRNMIESGGCSAIAEAVDMYEEELRDDDAFFSGKSEEWKEMYINTVLNGGDVLERCAMMKSFGSKESAVSSMWDSVYIV